jgi:hypothetical protein
MVHPQRPIHLVFLYIYPTLSGSGDEYILLLCILPISARPLQDVPLELNLSLAGFDSIA